MSKSKKVVLPSVFKATKHAMKALIANRNSILVSSEYLKYPSEKVFLVRFMKAMMIRNIIM